ncbi:MAG TPA: hypothetical protein PLV89_08030 [Treponemataceae bacterium]|nr:hypothetical protein [Treponemataceae bacterium]
MDKVSTVDLNVRQLMLLVEKLSLSVGDFMKQMDTPEKEQLFEKEFYTVEDCAKLKGGAALNTFKTNRFLLPGCGNPKFASYVGGRLCFPRSEVMKWLKVTDADYLDYAKECGITVIPEKLLHLSAKAGGSNVCAG